MPTRSIREARIFARRARIDFAQAGAVLPSSRFLARALCRGIDAIPAGERRILEVGGGTGAITREILARLQKGDRLVVYEIDSHLAAYLVQSPLVRAAGDRIEVRCEDIRALSPDERYDAVIMSLPLHNFEPDVIREIWKTLFFVSAPGGSISFFRYAGIPFWRSLTPTVWGRRTREARRTLDKIVKDRVEEMTLIWANTPPAWAVRVAV